MSYTCIGKLAETSDLIVDNKLVVDGKPVTSSETSTLQSVCDNGSTTTTQIECNNLIVSNGSIKYVNPVGLLTKGNKFLTTTASGDVVLEEVDYPITVLDLQQVTSEGSTSDVEDISFTSTNGTFTINQEKIDGSLLKINGGTLNGLVRIGEDENTYDYTNATRCVLIGRNSGSFNQGIDIIAIGSGAGNNNSGDYSVNVGDDSGQVSCGTQVVNIGRFAGEINSGASSVNLGAYANQNSVRDPAISNTICINATGVEVNSTVSDSCVIKPIRQSVNVGNETKILYYDETTGELRSGDPPIVQGTPGLSAVLQVNNTGGTMQLTQLDTTSLFIETSLNFVFNPTASINMGQIPYNNLTTSFAETLPLATGQLRYAGCTETWVCNVGNTINAGDLVGLSDGQGNGINRVKPYANATESGNNYLVGVALNNATENQAVFVLVSGITTVKCKPGAPNTNFLRGSTLSSNDDGVKNGIIQSNSAVLGYALETKVVSANDGILVKILRQYEHF